MRGLGKGRSFPTTRYRSPASMARTAAWVRSDTPSLEIMCCTWILTVPRLTSRFWAIWGLVCPWLSNLNTSTSLGVRLSICSAPSDCLDLLDLEWVASGWDVSGLVATGRDAKGPPSSLIPSSGGVLLAPGDALPELSPDRPPDPSSLLPPR